ncbi:hypothetical protein HQO84_16665 [Rhodococcus fascians]|nr:hypothetical protein [Rhodococcus fascians]MBY3998801.1 hypothetical protein [Rhodococcus fascians]MBY4003603.1 hypothetical protein [Rhodococcus fascians]MBY4008353.1 hypothetical protein [Rhodococcus fascians]MBY4018486.1 hypothetical protein [Rhodococcus fascians]
MSSMSRNDDVNVVDPIEELDAAGALYRNYLEISGVNSVTKLSQRAGFGAPLPAPLTLTFV